ncbi:MAG: DUF2630 family protein [Anaerolineae bacterium]|nr:DUF2630 family protein [Anaerolineae bacterium]
MNQIHNMANERHMLYRQAARQSLTAEQTRRLHELNGQLPLLWDRYRREYAARQRPQPIEMPRRIAA